MDKDTFIYLSDDPQISWRSQRLDTNYCLAVVYLNDAKRFTHSKMQASLQDAIATTQANWLWVEASAKITKEAILQAIELGMKKIICSQDKLFIKDIIEIKKKADQHQCLILGPGSTGIFNGQNGAIGYFSDSLCMPGSIAICSRSKSAAMALAHFLKNQQLGISQLIDLGSSELAFSEFSDFFPQLQQDQQTKLVILIGAEGSDFEQKAAANINQLQKPIFFSLIGKRMHNQCKNPSILSVFKERSIQNKSLALFHAGAIECASLWDIPEIIKEKVGEI